MSDMNIDNEFEALFLTDNAPAPAATAEPETLEERAAAIESMVSEPQPKPQSKYKTVDKIEIEGGPENSVSRVYPLGYVALNLKNTRFQNKLVLWVEDAESLIKFFRSPEADVWLANAKAAGLRSRGEGKANG